MAAEIAAVRSGSRVLANGNTDVRRTPDLEHAATRCVRELGSIDYVMYESPV